MKMGMIGIIGFGQLKYLPQNEKNRHLFGAVPVTNVPSIFLFLWLSFCRDLPSTNVPFLFQCL
jgi:hypothetical protein